MAATLKTHVAKAVSAAPTEALAGALKALVLARLRRARAPTQPSARPTPPMHAPPMHAPTQRRSARRIGRVRFYTPTSMPDVSRYGTFRKYMISTIRAHTDTRSANATHAQCDEPKFAKNKLDFNWAADNGFITWN